MFKNINVYYNKLKLKQLSVDSESQPRHTLLSKYVHLWHYGYYLKLN